MTKTRDIRQTVEAELTFDPLVDAMYITVKNMGGDVALNGWVPSYPSTSPRPRPHGASPV
jgi:osmotically-inducible protein OsmY